MKNNKNKLNKSAYKKIALIVILILLLLALIIIITKTNNKINKIALGQNALEIGEEEIDISGVISIEPNPPVVGAGMIPIKWDEEEQMWVITTVEDKEWYDYSQGKWANVMLSDGYYKSELQRNITSDQLAENNVDTRVSGDTKEDIHTRFNIYLDSKTYIFKR